MDLSSLQRLADEGIGRFPPVSLVELSEWCWSVGEDSGDARYCVISRTLDMLSDLFDASYESVASRLVERLDTDLARLLPEVLDASSSQEGTRKAAVLRESLAAAIAED